MPPRPVPGPVDPGDLIPGDRVRAPVIGREGRVTRTVTGSDGRVGMVIVGQGDEPWDEWVLAVGVDLEDVMDLVEAEPDEPGEGTWVGNPDRPTDREPEP